jgi:hypothetical protein
MRLFQISAITFWILAGGIHFGFADETNDTDTDINTDTNAENYDWTIPTEDSAQDRDQPANTLRPRPGPGGGFNRPHPNPNPGNIFTRPHPRPWTGRPPHPRPPGHVYPPFPSNGNNFPWRRWRHPNVPRPIYDWPWFSITRVTCTAQDSNGYIYPVTEYGNRGAWFPNRLNRIQDEALNRCYYESGQDPGCHLLGCHSGF